MDIFKALFQQNLDAEYNRYVILAQIKKSEDFFQKRMLFPVYRQLMEQYKVLSEIKQNYDDLQSALSKDLKLIDLKHQRLVYDQVPLAQFLDETYALLEFALPRLKSLLDQGKALHDAIKHEMALKTVGVEPLYTKEGLLVLHHQAKAQHHVFSYSTHVIENLKEDDVFFKTTYINTFPVKDGKWTPENIKYHFMQKHKKDFPVPATYVIEYGEKIPVFETFLPISREVFLEKVYGNT